MSFEEDHSLSHSLSRSMTEVSQENSINYKASNESDSRDSEVEFADVVEKLSFAINNVRQLKPWKDRALKAERNNRQLSLTITRLKEELNDSEYEAVKWKKRALRAEGENQDEVLKWKNKAIKARTTIEVRTDRKKSNKDTRDDQDLLMAGVDDGETFTNLVSERDDDESTISTFRDDSKFGQDLTGKSFRSKWDNMGFDHKPTPTHIPVRVENNDGASTVAAQQILQNFERGNVFGSSKPERGNLYGTSKVIPDDSSTVAAEEILNNYLNMKGRFNSRRFDTSSKLTADAVHKEEFEI